MRSSSTFVPVLTKYVFCHILQGMMFGLLIGARRAAFLRWCVGITLWTTVRPMTIQRLSTKSLRSLSRYAVSLHGRISQGLGTADIDCGLDFYI